MHMTDTLIIPRVALVMYGASFLIACFCMIKVTSESYLKKLPLIGILGSFVFTLQMLNLYIPETFSYGQFCGGLLLSAILGPYASYLILIVSLIVQIFLFKDSGLLALGCNLWNMFFYECFFATLLVWNPIMKKKGYNKKNIIKASFIGCLSSYVLGVVSFVAQNIIAHVTWLNFGQLIIKMMPVNLVLGLLEGIITSGLLCFIFVAKPEFLWNPYGDKTLKTTGKLSAKKTSVILGAITIVLAIIITTVAYYNPSGIELSFLDNGAYEEETLSPSIATSKLFGFVIVFILCVSSILTTLFVKIKSE